ncbi:MAG: hypothetical protein AWU59_1886 [Methanolobus sp. T82-4]|nr:MAG: hypothetical protein AWU59_1886 [Methanolobus sp. T82-4]
MKTVSICIECPDCKKLMIPTPDKKLWCLKCKKTHEASADSYRTMISLMNIVLKSIESKFDE